MATPYQLRKPCLLDPADPCGTCAHCAPVCGVCLEAPASVMDEAGNLACDECAEAIAELERRPREWRP